MGSLSWGLLWFEKECFENTKKFQNPLYYHLLSEFLRLSDMSIIFLIIFLIFLILRLESKAAHVPRNCSSTELYPEIFQIILRQHLANLPMLASNLQCSCFILLSSCGSQAYITFPSSSSCLFFNGCLIIILHVPLYVPKVCTR